MLAVRAMLAKKIYNPRAAPAGILIRGERGSFFQVRKITNEPNRSNINAGKHKPTPVFPYGYSSWKLFREEKAFYADRTATIKLLDGYHYSFLRRPRRFGKTLLMDQLEKYYDIAEKDKFAENFQGTAIYDETEFNDKSQGKLLVLNLSFGDIQPNRKLLDNFHRYMNNRVRFFSRKYHDDLGILKREIQVVDDDNSLRSLSNLINEVALSDQKFVLLVDEFDAFASRMLLDMDPFDKSEYDKTVGAAEAIVRNWGNVVKHGTTSSLDRFFFTGVAPLAFNDGLSSLNFTEDLTLDKTFQSSLGLSSSDLDDALDQLDLTQEEKERHKAVIVAEFDGYRFVEGQQEGLFNPQLALYYLDTLAKSGEAPVELADPNVIDPSDNVAKFLLDRYAAVDTSGTNPLWQFVLGDFTANVRTDLRGSTYFSSNKEIAGSTFISLAYHHGFLTFPDPNQKTPLFRQFVPMQKGMIGLIAPNRTYRKLFLESALKLDDAMATKVLRAFDDAEPVVKPGRERDDLSKVAVKETVRQIVKASLIILKQFVFPTVVDRIESRL